MSGAPVNQGCRRRASDALPRCSDDLIEPPPSSPDDWRDGALSVRRCCDEYDISRDKAYELMRSGRLLWARLDRQRRISRRSAARLFANDAESSTVVKAEVRRLEGGHE